MRAVRHHRVRLRALAVAGRQRPITPSSTSPPGNGIISFTTRRHFERAGAVFNADPYLTVKLLFRKGDPADAGKPASTSQVRRNGGWFGPLNAAPDLPRDADVVAEEELAGLRRSLAPQWLLRPRLLLHEPHRQRSLRRARQRDLGHAVLLHRCALRLRMQHRHVAPRRTDARTLHQFARSRGRRRPLGRAGKFHARSTRCSRWLASDVASSWPAPALTSAAPCRAFENDHLYSRHQHFQGKSFIARKGQLKLDNYGATMPVTGKAVQKPPFYYRHMEMMFITYRTDDDAATTWLPSRWNWTVLPPPRSSSRTTVPRPSAPTTKR